MELNYQDLRRLAELLKTTEEDSDSEDDLPQKGLSALGNVLNHGLNASARSIVNIIHMLKTKLLNLVKPVIVSLSLCISNVYFIGKYLR
jgi:hypothetical protein